MSDTVDSIVMLTGAEYRKMKAEITVFNHFAVKYRTHIDEQNVEVARLTAENAKLRAAIERALRQLADGNKVLATGTLADVLSGDKP
jgi:hypothetical protein